jgi:tetrahydromethanopterin S-methyltransferase subunit A
LEVKIKIKKTIFTEEEKRDAMDTTDVLLDWNPDPKGYFTIKPIFSQKKVFVRYYDTGDNLKHTFSGVNTSQIIQEIIKRKLVSRLDHAAYLGKEIEKAVIALKNKLEYVQDKELKLK